ncbi:MAG: zinc finger domain-containing protein, partial [Bryobacteraceae bacterium]
LCDASQEEDPLGPDANDPSLSTDYLTHALASRRIPIKVALLDQAVVAGIGNIYASEALWRARINPRTPAQRLSRRRLGRLVKAIQATMRDALNRQRRYYGSEGIAPEARFAVYDREGGPCRRCGKRIRRIPQAARSTYYCGNCQR